MVDSAGAMRHSAGTVPGPDAPVPPTAPAGAAPGPGGNPLHDHLRPFEADPLDFLTRVQREHGDVVRLRLWPDVCHLVSDPDEVTRLLVTEAHRFHPEPDGTSLEAIGPAPRFHQLARSVLHGDAGVTAQ